MLKTAQNKGKIQCRYMEIGSDVAGKLRRKRQQEHPAIEGTGGRRRLPPLGAGTACFFLERMSAVNGTRQEHTFIV